MAELDRPSIWPDKFKTGMGRTAFDTGLEIDKELGHTTVIEPCIIMMAENNLTKP